MSVRCDAPPVRRRQPTTTQAPSRPVSEARGIDRQLGPGAFPPDPLVKCLAQTAYEPADTSFTSLTSLRNCVRMPRQEVDDLKCPTLAGVPLATVQHALVVP